MINKLKQIEQRYNELGESLGDLEIISDPRKLRDVSKEYSSLENIIRLFKKYEKISRDLESDQAIVSDSDDPELREIAELEIAELSPQLDNLEEQLKFELLPKDPNDARNAILEIRAGTGGDEAGLFAGDLFRMYSRYAERNGWKVDILNSNPQGIGGFKEIIAMIEGENVFGKLKFEGGVHRVQRVPVTETSGRIHTSAATVAVLPEAEEVDIKIDPNDLRIDVYRSSGPGGQSVNTTDSAVRVTHIPTGMVVTCQDEKSQHKNKAKALKVLRARLLERKQQEEMDKVTANRRKMVSTGDRSAKIRTYNFPQGRITDHRIHFTLYQLEDVLDGNLNELLDKLSAEERQELLQEV
jgi:peptide chain release factor 1